jgi:DNA-binding beta-propeller fold protein YncE
VGTTSIGTLGRIPVFELEASWGSLPAGWELGQTGIATDSADNVYLFNRGSHPLIVLDREGRFLDSWGDDVLTDAHGLFIDADDFVYLPVRRSHVVLRYTRDGNLDRTFGAWNVPSQTGYAGSFGDPVLRAAGPFNSPTDVAVSPSGDIYVSDGYGNARVHRFKPDGTLLQSWGRPGGSDPAEFRVPHGIWVHSDGRVFVADRENNRIQIFDATGGFLEMWEGLSRPADIFIDATGLVFVAELDSLVAIFDLTGNLLTRWENPAGERTPMKGGHAIWLDSHGDVYVGQNQPGQRLLKYRRVGSSAWKGSECHQPNSDFVRNTSM